jgi:hypothetical protein
VYFGDGNGITNGPVIDGPISGEVGSAACSLGCCSLAGGVVASSAPAEAAPSTSNAQEHALPDRIPMLMFFTGFAPSRHRRAAARDSRFIVFAMAVVPPCAGSNSSG